MSLERAAFMAALGITEEDVIDPDHLSSPVQDTKGKSHESTKENCATASKAATHVVCDNHNELLDPVKNQIVNNINNNNYNNNNFSSHIVSLSSSDCSNGLSLSQSTSSKVTQTSFKADQDNLHSTSSMQAYNVNTHHNYDNSHINKFVNHHHHLDNNSSSGGNNSHHTKEKHNSNNNITNNNNNNSISNNQYQQQQKMYNSNLLPLTLTFHADMRAAEEMKQAGNVAFEVGDFIHSIRHYTHAIDTLTIYSDNLLQKYSEHSQSMNNNNNNGNHYYNAQYEYDNNGICTNNNTTNNKTNNDCVYKATINTPSISLYNNYELEQQELTLMLQTEELDELVLLLASLFSNCSASFLQAAKLCESIEYAHLHALSDAETTISLRPGWFKGYSRQGDVYFKMKEYNKAADAFAMAVQLAPSNNNLQHSLHESERRAREYNAADRMHRSLFPLEQEQQLQEQHQQYMNSGTKNAHSSYNTSNNIKDNIFEEIREHKKQNEHSNGNKTNTNRNLSVNLLLSKSTTTTTTINNNDNNGDDDNNNNRDIKPKSKLAKKMWEEFKHEMETTSSTPTGDDYRKAQLAKFREAQEQRKKNTINLNKENTTKPTTTTTTASSEIRKVVTNAINNNNYNHENKLLNELENKLLNEDSEEGKHNHSSDVLHEAHVSELSNDEEYNVASNKTQVHTHLPTFYPHTIDNEQNKIKQPATQDAKTTNTSMKSNMHDEWNESDNLSVNDTIREKRLKNASHINQETSINITQQCHNHISNNDVSNSSRRKSSTANSSVSNNSVSHLCEMDIPQEFSSSAAAAYQQKLLAEYRKKKRESSTHVK